MKIKFCQDHVNNSRNDFCGWKNVLKHAPMDSGSVFYHDSSDHVPHLSSQTFPLESPSDPLIHRRHRVAPGTPNSSHLDRFNGTGGRSTLDSTIKGITTPTVTRTGTERTVEVTSEFLHLAVVRAPQFTGDDLQYNVSKIQNLDKRDSVGCMRTRLLLWERQMAFRSRPSHFPTPCVPSRSTSYVEDRRDHT